MDFFPQALAPEAQIALLAAIGEVIAEAPLFTPAMPRSGKPMSVRMTNCGPLGWVTDKERGYRYQATHPTTGKAWPPIPATLLELWRARLGGVTMSGMVMYSLTTESMEEIDGLYYIVVEAK